MYTTPGTVNEGAMRQRFEFLKGLLDGKLCWCLAAAKAQTIGFGGASSVARATGVSRRAIRVGTREVAESPPPGGRGERIRKPGGGCKWEVAKDPTWRMGLERLVEPTTRGIRTPRCAGPVRACGGSRRNLPARGTALVIAW